MESYDDTHHWTSKLWLQYMDMIDIIRRYIWAERTGNWELHLQTLSEMLPFLAASGHNNYTKSVWIYLQQMSHLQEDHPEVYEHFGKGLHVISSDRYWAGLSSDLVIKQVLTRIMKTSIGLTRGRGMTEQQRVIWSLAMPAYAEMNRAMQELASTSFNSGKQNKDITKSREAHDWKDTQILLNHLQERNSLLIQACETFALECTHLVMLILTQQKLLTVLSWKTWKVNRLLTSPSRERTSYYTRHSHCCQIW